MRYISKTVGYALLSLSISAHAGFNGTTAHSRANCGNNESITWNALASYWWKVVSFHNNIYGTQYDHVVDTGWAQTWRQAAVHWGEAPLNDHRWIVHGYHFFIDYGNGKVPFAEEIVGDCSIYDGWWDI